MSAHQHHHKSVRFQLDRTSEHVGTYWGHPLPTPPSKNKQQNDSNININSPLYSTLSFKWHDITEGSFLFEQALLQTLKNIKITLIKDIDKLASTIDMKNQRELQNLSTELNLVKHKQKIEQTHSN